MDALLYQKNLSGLPQPLPPDLRLAVKTYTKVALGGCKSASVQAQGARESVAQALTWLRCPIEIVNERSDKVWWGFVAGVQLQWQQHRLSVSLDNMANRLKVIYSETLPGNAGSGTKTTTAAADHALSQAEYGIKEMLITLNNATAAQAEQLRDRVLAERALPLIQDTPAATLDAPTATLDCRGWWEMLKWQYYSHAVDSEQYTTGGTHLPPDNKFGHGPFPHAVATRFKLPNVSDRWLVTELCLKIRIEPNEWKPMVVDDVIAELYADDGAGLPGALLATSTAIKVDQITQDYPPPFTHWYVSVPHWIDGSQYYWVVVRSTDFTDSYWQLRYEGRDDGDYAHKRFAGFDGAVWTLIDAGTSLFFQVFGTQDTLTQLGTMAASGQLIAGVDKLGITESGIRTSQYRAGERDLQNEMLDLMNGGTTGGQRLLAQVSAGRRVQFWAEPLPSDVALQVDGQFALRVNPSGMPLPGDLCPVGQWVNGQGVIPPTVQAALLAPPFPWFVEEASYDAASGQWKPLARGISNVFRIAGL